MQKRLLTRAMFNSYITNETKTALDAIKQNIKNPNILNQFSARANGWSSYEAIERTFQHEDAVKDGILVDELITPQYASYYVIRTGDAIFLLDRDSAQLSYALKESPEHTPLHNIAVMQTNFTATESDYESVHVEFDSQRDKEASFALKIDGEDVLLNLTRNEQSVDIMIIYDYTNKTAGSFTKSSFALKQSSDDVLNHFPLEEFGDFKHCKPKHA